MTSNPFATRFIRPGAIPFLFPAGQSAESLVEELRQQHWNGQIVGPHGSGKSTLLMALIPAFQPASRQVILVRVQSSGPKVQNEAALPSSSHNAQDPTTWNLEPGTWNLSRTRARLPALNSASQLIIDGFEQLSWLDRFSIKRLCRASGAGLLVTTHRDLNLPTIYRTQPTLELAQSVVDMLLAPGDRLVSADDVARAFAATKGDLRETLFTLYDIYQSRAP